MKLYLAIQGMNTWCSLSSLLFALRLNLCVKAFVYNKYI